MSEFTVHADGKGIPIFVDADADIVEVVDDVMDLPGCQTRVKPMAPTITMAMATTAAPLVPIALRLLIKPTTFHAWRTDFYCRRHKLMEGLYLDGDGLRSLRIAWRRLR